MTSKDMNAAKAYEAKEEHTAIRRFDERLESRTAMENATAPMVEAITSRV